MTGFPVVREPALIVREKEEGLTLELAKPHIPLHTDLALESGVLRILWQRGLTTLQSLQTPLGVTASGQNDHFHAIFGRDSLWTVLLALEAGRVLQAKEKTSQAESWAGTSIAPTYRTWLHDLAATVLRGLASLQGKVVDDVNEEQPGRIVHEYWDPVPKRMVLARWPVAYGKGRYYGAFDATFLYLITIAQVDRSFSDAALLEELWPSVELALQWMLNWSDIDSDGLVEYNKRNPEGIGLANQVWKDSAESVQAPEHEPLKHPLAWVEVQGYAWAAYAAYLELARKRGTMAGESRTGTSPVPTFPDPSLEQEILRRMDDLQKGLLRFWLSEEQFPAIVLDEEKQPVPAVSSNPGHLLWSGCLNQAQAEQICVRLMQPDLFTPWGLRTLSQHAYYYNPLMYHCGAIWPFDNAVIAIGLRRYGFAEEARRIANAVLEAMFAFDEPVELYTVQPARWLRSHRIEQDWFLADYFHACRVQAWTAGAILYFTSMFL